MNGDHYYFIPMYLFLKHGICFECKDTRWKKIISNKRIESWTGERRIDCDSMKRSWTEKVWNRKTDPVTYIRNISRSKIEAPKIEQKLYVSDMTHDELSVSENTNNDTYYDKLYSFIKLWEGEFQSVAFCDSYYSNRQKIKYWINSPGKIRHPDHLCTRYSIWFWTKSFLWETITYEEWIKRKQEDVQHRDSMITSTCLTENQRIAVVDFFYQHWVNSSNVKYYANTCRVSSIYNAMVWWRDYYSGKIPNKNWEYVREFWMVKREQLRINLFYK